MRRLKTRRFAGISTPLLHLSVASFFLVALMVGPVAVDRVHMADTVLLANIGWRGVNGLTAVIDYPHFYGGFTEAIVTAAFKMFGVSYKSIDYAFVLMFAVAAVFVVTLCWKRLRFAEISLLIALAAALILSLNALEAVQHFTPAHSFVYNHVGIVLMLSLTVFACRPVQDRHVEFVSALAAGCVLYLLILLKTTFGLFGLSLILACVVQRRWASAGLVLLGVAVAMLLLDPGMEKALGSLDLLLTSSAATDAGGLEGRLIIAWLMILTQSLPIAIVLILGFALWQRAKLTCWPLIASLVICAAGYSAAMLTTGGSPQHKLLPLLIVAALLITEALAEHGTAEQPATRGKLFSAIPIILAYLVILPALATSVLALKRSFQDAESSLIEAGPLSNYVVFEQSEPTNVGTVSERLKAATAIAVARVRSGETLPRDQYVMFADGIAMLRRIDGIRKFGIVPSGRNFDFSTALEAKIVRSFPVWPSSESPELMTTSPLEPDVDMVMILDETASLELVGSALRARMGQDFRRCRRSAFWTLFVRRSLLNVNCTVSEVRNNPMRRHGV